LRAAFMMLSGKHRHARFVGLEFERIVERRDDPREWIPKLGLEPGYTKGYPRTHALVASVSHKVDVDGIQLAMNKAERRRLGFRHEIRLKQCRQLPSERLFIPHEMSARRFE